MKLGYLGRTVVALAALSAMSACGGTSVEGVDTENRGYRDDVAQLIRDRYSTSPELRQGAIEVAKAFQASLLQPPAITNEAEFRVGVCAVSRVAKKDELTMLHATKAIYARTFNTPARIAARQKYVRDGLADAGRAFPVDPTRCELATRPQFKTGPN